VEGPPGHETLVDLDYSTRHSRSVNKFLDDARRLLAD